MRAVPESRSTHLENSLAQCREMVTIGIKEIVNNGRLRQGFDRFTRSHRRRPIGVQPISANVAEQRLRMMRTADC
jgi:hypothetical protein